MTYRLLISGDRADFTILAFELESKQLSIIANYPGPFNVSWVEKASSQGSVDHLIGLSEGTESGLLYSFEIDHANKTCQTTSQQPTLGAPAHFITLYDKSALALATFLGGSVALYPISINGSTGSLSLNAPPTEILPEFSYKFTGYGPNRGRQQQCHIHQVLEDSRGLLYAPDLGSDRVWIFRRDQMELEVCGWLQCPPGTGARHAQISPDERLLYIIGELSHTVIAFDLVACPAESVNPIDGFEPNIIPPSVHPDHQKMMDSAELCLHPRISNILYASNRWERHISEREPHLANVPMEIATGDAIAIILLSDNGMEVEDIKFVRTKLDSIRGMRLSDTGDWVVVCGQEGGGVEIYGISGKRGDVWTLVAKIDEGLESGIKHAIWL